MGRLGHFFTVFTPTYNRASTLPRLYESIKNQTFQDFEWVIVDDGSLDETAELVEKWQNESNQFPIRYFWQPNQHKKVAFNRAVREARGEMFVPIDSDDEFVAETLGIFHRCWTAIRTQERKHFTGICGLCVDQTGRIVGEPFPRDILDSDSLELFFRYRVAGEKFGFHRLDVLKKYPFPEDIPGYVPEGLVWFRIAKKYKTRFVNETVRIYHTDTESIVRPRDRLRALQNNTQGALLSYKEALSVGPRYLKYCPICFLKLAANYTRFALHLTPDYRGRYPLEGFLPNLLRILAYPVGLALYCMDRLKFTAYIKRRFSN